MCSKGVAVIISSPPIKLSHTWLAWDTFFSTLSWSLPSSIESWVSNEQGDRQQLHFRGTESLNWSGKEVVLCLLKLWCSHTHKIHFKLFCCILLFIRHSFQSSTGKARVQDQLYSQRICYLKHHVHYKRGGILVLGWHASFNTVVLCKLQLNIYNSLKNSKRDLVLKHSCDVDFARFFFISKYLQLFSTDVCVETSYEWRVYSNFIRRHSEVFAIAKL